MVAKKLEELLRFCSSLASRRGLLAGLASGLTAALSFALVADEAAAKKKRRKRKKKRKKKRPSPTRQVVTQTFSNPGAIIIPSFGNADGPADPYASTIQVSGFTNGVITDVNVLLNRVNHTYPDDLNVLLAATHIPGRNAIILSDVGGSADVVSVNLVLDDQVPTPLPNADPIVSGAFQPTNEGAGDTFPSPAPIPTGNSALSTFHGQDPNGTWQLFVHDQGGGDNGFFAGGWALQITAEVDV